MVFHKYSKTELEILKRLRQYGKFKSIVKINNGKHGYRSFKAGLKLVEKGIAKINKHKDEKYTKVNSKGITYTIIITVFELIEN